MTIEKFNEQLSEIKKGASIADIHISPDFQCDTTDGFPTSLCVHWDKGKAWLELKESLIDDESAVKNARQQCANYGIRNCEDVETFNNLLEGLGRDAYESGYIPEESEQGMSL